MQGKKGSLKSLVSFARKRGADEARIIDVEDVVVDPRVRLKCEIPRCSSFGSHLLCPPNLMPVEEFEKALRRYKRAMVVQKEADHDSLDKSDGGLTLELCDELESGTAYIRFEKALHKLVNEVEAEAFKRGCYLALGLIGGECLLCDECVGPGSGEPCRHPFQARPSMEAMGIDVIATCEKAGIPVHLSSEKKVRWTGIVLLD